MDRLLTTLHALLVLAAAGLTIAAAHQLAAGRPATVLPVLCLGVGLAVLWTSRRNL